MKLFEVCYRIDQMSKCVDALIWGTPIVTVEEGTDKYGIREDKKDPVGMD
jgi:hypothetical protein